MVQRLISLLSILVFFGCGEEISTPKPVGYFRIDLPEGEYIRKSPENCPFTFEQSTLGRLEYQVSQEDEQCWFNLSYPRFDAKIYLTYKEVDQNLRGYIEESRALTYEHQIKANRISEVKIDDQSRSVYGLVYDLGGAVASPVQFYLTDSTNHFLRGSLYFEAKPNPDSIAPVLAYVKKDIELFTRSLEWK
jgi:gliding motility-associated lipoprotein GldD